MVVVNGFTYSTALVCAGMDVTCFNEERNLNAMMQTMKHKKNDYGDPNISLDDDSLFARYCIFVQYAAKWPTGQQVRGGLPVELNKINSDERAGAMVLVGYTTKQCSVGKYIMKCTRFDQKSFDIPRKRGANAGFRGPSNPY